MNRHAQLICKLLASFTVMDMGFGKAVGNLTFQQYADQLWTGQLYSNSVMHLFADTIIGLICGVVGLLLAIRTCQELFRLGVNDDIVTFKIMQPAKT
jgi:hypothetical protein